MPPTKTIYKKMNIPWISEIPAHWQVRRLKYLGNLYAGLSGKSGDDFLNEKKVNKFYIPFTNIANNTFINVKQLKKVFIDSNENQNKIEKGDLLFLMSSETSEDIGKSALVNDFLEEVYLNSFCRGLRITSNLINAEYLVYLLNSNLYRNKLSIEGRGFTRINLKKDNLMNLYALIPPKQEQTAIAGYLDRQVEKINHFIKKKRHYIALLEEQRQAIINQAVTQGINPNAVLKNSGIEGLGEIPAHWELRKLSYSFDKIGSGATPKSGDKNYYENGHINWINTGDLNDGILLKCSNKITSKAIEDYSTLKMYNIGSIVIAMYGATIGKVSILGIEGCTNQACCVLDSSPYFHNKYLFYWFMAHKDYLISKSYGGGQPNISQDVIKQLRVSCPQKQEQTAIASYIKTKTAKIDRAIAKVQKEIELIHEYKEAMIAEAVLGKLVIEE